VEIWIFCTFCSCDFDLDPMTFTYKLDQYSLKISQQTENELSTSKLLKVIILHTDGETYKLPVKL